MVIELIEGGFLAQLVIVLIIWGAIGVLAIELHPIPDPLLDAGFIVLGFYFRSAVQKASNMASKQTGDTNP